MARRTAEPSPPKPLPITRILLRCTVGEVVDKFMEGLCCCPIGVETGVAALVLGIEQFTTEEFAVKVVVCELEGEPEVSTEIGEGLGHAGEMRDATRFDGQLKKRDSLKIVHGLSQFIAAGAFESEIQALAANERGAIESAQESELEAAEARVFAIRGLDFDNHARGEGDHREGCQKGGGFAELDV